MPIKLNWTRGRNIGLAMIFIGIMGFVQVVFIAIAQYGMKVGSLYLVGLIPVGAIFATFYSTIVFFESNMSMSKYREFRPSTKNSKKKKESNKRVSKKSKTGKSGTKMSWKTLAPYLKPILYVIGIFAATFGITYAIIFKLVDQMTVRYVICENVAAILTLLAANYYETAMARKTR